MITFKSLFKIASLLVASLIIVANLYYLVPVRAHGMVDQSAEVDISSDFSYTLYYTPSVSQSFTPKVDSLTGIDLALSTQPYIIYSPNPGFITPDQSMPGEFDISILDASRKTLASQVGFLPPSTKSNYFHYDFDPIDLTPGETYYIQLSIIPGSDPGMVTWYYDWNNPYPGGSGMKAEEDFGFRTYFEEIVDGGGDGNQAPTAFDQGLTMDAGEQIEIILNATDPEGDSLTFDLWREPTNGEIEKLSEDGRIMRYTPDPSFVGQTTFSFRASDGDSSNVATVTIDVINSPASIQITLTHASINDPLDQVTREYTGGTLEIPQDRVVTLDASESFDPNGSVLRFDWWQTSGPIIELENPKDSIISFTIPSFNTTTDLVFQLTIDDGMGAISNSEVPIRVLVSNLPPIANAGIDVVADGGEEVTLDGSKSTDPDQDPLTYLWTQLSGDSELVNLTDAESATPSFFAPTSGNITLSFQLVVTDDLGASNSDLVNIVVSSVTNVTTVDPTPFDFGLSVSPSSSDISPGSTAIFEVEVVQLSGELVPISLEVIVPEEIAGIVDIEYDNTPAAAPYTRLINVTAHDGLQAQDYSIVIVGSNGNQQRLVEKSVAYAINVVPTKETGFNAGLVAAAIGIPIAAFAMLSHFVLPKPVSDPSPAPGKGHSFGFRIEVQLQQPGFLGGMPGGTPIPGLSEFSAMDTIKNSFNQLLLQDTGEMIDQGKQLKVVKDWLKKGLKRGDPTSSTVSDHTSAGNVEPDVGSKLKQIISENLGKASAPELVQMIKQALVTEATSRLEKGIEHAAIPLIPLHPNILFIPIIDGIEIRTNMLTLAFEIVPIIELKDAKTILTGDAKSFFADFVDLRMKLYYLLPMMIGMKKIKFGENLTHVARNVSVKLNKQM